MRDRDKNFQEKIISLGSGPITLKRVDGHSSLSLLFYAKCHKFYMK